MSPTKAVRLTEAHLDDVAGLEQLSFGEPWSKTALSLLTGEEALGFVCLEDGRAVAYGGMMLARNRWGMDTVKNVGAKYTVLLSDGEAHHSSNASTRDDGTANDGSANDGTANDDAANDESGSECSASTVWYIYKCSSWCISA